jgi:hypothetical protein
VTWCAICLRKTRGFGFSPHLIGYVARSNQKFCSLRCLNFYEALFRKGNGMVDPTDFERVAIQSCLMPLGECVAEIGMDKPLSAYSKEQVLTLIEVIVTAYQDAMRKGSPEVPF